MPGPAILKGEAWALIPARGGSRSIPLKNLAKLAGHPLMEYGLRAAAASRAIRAIFCSTDHPVIARFAKRHGAQVVRRPDHLCRDDSPTAEAVRDFIMQMARKGPVAEMIALVEPTSPFLLPSHIDAAVRLLRRHPGCDSVQTITRPPPNHHAYNQRRLDNGWVRFRFPSLRRGKSNKQSKPVFFVHGNLRVFRTQSFLRSGCIFGRRSLPLEIGRIYGLDADSREDFRWAGALLKAKLIRLPHWRRQL